MVAAAAAEGSLPRYFVISGLTASRDVCPPAAEARTQDSEPEKWFSTGSRYALSRNRFDRPGAVPASQSREVTGTTPLTSGVEAAQESKGRMSHRA